MTYARLPKGGKSAGNIFRNFTVDFKRHERQSQFQQFYKKKKKKKKLKKETKTKHVFKTNND